MVISADFEKQKQYFDKKKILLLSKNIAFVKKILLYQYCFISLSQYCLQNCDKKTFFQQYFSSSCELKISIHGYFS
jgi:hypothetical protein